ncbi:MAG TPA: bacteriohemerythrin [Eubacteriaceae bacterium]|nr:bacteriohemerythrin [Eubacteriaceae bacterium]
MIKWKEDYRVGIEIIDEQHQKLFEIAARAYDLLKNEFIEDKYDRIKDILEELKSYTIFHFETEEKYMEEIGYKKLFSHKVYHEEFIGKIKSVDLKEVDENQEGYLISILELVVNWIDEHILNKDMLIAKG